MTTKTKEFDLFNSPLNGKNLIEASAGTGKTFTIAHLYLRLLIEKEDVEVENILVVTFTKAATHELKDRIHQLLLKARAAFENEMTENKFKYLNKYVQSRRDRGTALKRIETAIRDFDEACVFTIDSFCNKVLLENAFESNGLFDTELVTEQNEILQSIVEDWWRGTMYHESLLFARYVTAKTSPMHLFKLFVDKVGLLYLHVIPAVDDDIDCSDFEKQFTKSFETVRDLWPGSKDEISKILKNKNSILSRARYGTTKIPFWLHEMDSYTTASDAHPLLPSGFVKFTNSELRNSTRKDYKPPNHHFFDACEEHFTNFTGLEKVYETRLIQLKQYLFRFAKTELKRRKEEQNVYFFDDLRMNLHLALTHPEREQVASTVRQKYKAALIDEFQDTDPIQYEIFQSIFYHKDAILFVIGDPKQAIYGFRGADVFAYMRAKRETDDHFTLTTNHRSTPGLLKAFNTLFSQAKNDAPFVYKEIGYEEAIPAEKAKREELIIEGESNAPLQLWFVEVAKYAKASGYGRLPKCLYKRDAVPIIIKSVADEIARLLTLGRAGKARIGDQSLQPKHIAVLVRENKQARDLQERLTQVGVHSVLYSTSSLFKSREAEELSRILAAIAEPKRTFFLRAALATEIIGLTSSELFATLEHESLLESWYEKMTRYHATWRDAGFIRMFKLMMREGEWLTRLMSLQDGERRITNLYHLADILNEIEINRRLGMAGLISWLDEKRSSETMVAEEHQLRLESDENAVMLITLHMSKGLQYPVVFCPFTWAGAYLRNPKEFAFHANDDEHTFTLDIGSEQIEENREVAKIEELAQNLRLLYVGLTRAEHRSYLVWGYFGEAPQSAPGYLLHQPNRFQTDRFLDGLRRHFDGLGDIAMLERLKEIEKESDGGIHVTPLPDRTGQRFSQDMETASELSHKKFEANIDTSHTIASYSSLVTHIPHGAELPDYDEIEDAEVTVTEEITQPEGFIAFPPGTRTGTFVHSLLEEFDFTSSDRKALDELIENKLQTYGFGFEWKQVIRSLVERVQTMRLGHNGEAFTLAKVSKESRLNELGFYFPLKILTPKELRDVFKTLDSSDANSSFEKKIEQLTFSPFQGFMKGFIDLVLENNGRYYIIDWKSNYLGESLADYHEQALSKAMAENLYFLQYHLYTVALDRYLQLRLHGYEYEKHFGGAYYIFLRGLDANQTNAGIFYDRPKKELITSLSQILLPDETR